MKLCSQPNCMNKLLARGLCNNHYHLARRANTLPPTKRNFIEDITTAVCPHGHIGQYNERHLCRECHRKHKVDYGEDNWLQRSAKSIQLILERRCA